MTISSWLSVIFNPCQSVSYYVMPFPSDFMLISFSSEQIMAKLLRHHKKFDTIQCIYDDLSIQAHPLRKNEGRAIGRGSITKGRKHLHTNSRKRLVG
jgi:hypothetical protein